jgi:cobalt-precorrin-5B (C1)-methyltransferase
VRSGYTLPVFAAASAIAALRCLQGGLSTFQDGGDLAIELDLINPPQRVQIPIEQVCQIKTGMALAITHSDPGDNLDLTRHTPVWAIVEWAEPTQVELIALVGGEGVGKQVNLDNRPAFYHYAKTLLQANLAPLLDPEEKIVVTIILPEGRKLATRTSNAAFGVVEGLSLLGTSGISQPLSAPGQLEACLIELREKVRELGVGSGGVGSWELGVGSWEREGEGKRGRGEKLSLESSYSDRDIPLPVLVLCIGENGLALAREMGISPDRTLKTANWLGSVLVAAGVEGVKNILLFGYHGKLIKLAGGIFHTHHHLADGRAEIFIAAAVRVGLPTECLQRLLDCETAEAGLNYLRELDRVDGSEWVAKIYSYLAETIDRRSQKYIYDLCQQQVRVGSVLFDRSRKIIATSGIGDAFLTRLC